MRVHSFLWTAVVVAAAVACDGREATGPATLTPSNDGVAFGIGEHGGGPPGSVVFYSRRGGTPP
jgi:hypothetical protein